jgi:hypothetical protein
LVLEVGTSLSANVNLGKFFKPHQKKNYGERGFMKGKTIEFDYEFDTQKPGFKINIIQDGILNHDGIPILI